MKRDKFLQVFGSLAENLLHALKVKVLDNLAPLVFSNSDIYEKHHNISHT